MAYTDSGTPSLFGTRRRQAVGAAVVLALAVVPFTTTSYVTEIVFVGLIFAMLGISWNLLAGYAGQISLGHAAFFGIGAFVSAWMTTPGRAGLPEAIQTPMVLSLLGGAIAAALLALVTGPVVFRLTGHYFAIGTLALATIVQLVVLDLREYSGGSSGFFVEESMGETGVFLIALAATVLTFLASYWMVNHSSGLGMRAIHGDESAASSLGVNPLKYKMYAFVSTSFMAGLAGALFAQYQLFIKANTTIGVEWMIDTLVVVILGGMGTILGPVVGAGVFFLMDNLLPSLVGSYSTTVEGLLIIVVIIFAPKGVYGFLRDRSAGAETDGISDEDEGPGIERPASDQTE